MGFCILFDFKKNVPNMKHKHYNISIEILQYFVYYINVKEVRLMLDFDENKRNLNAMKNKLEELGESL